MSSGSRRLPAQSDSEDSSSEDSAAKATQGPKRRGRDVTPDENPAPLPPRARKATSKQSKTDKENMDALEQRVTKAQKDLSKFKQKAMSVAPPAVDDAFESEEPMSDHENNGFPSSIVPLGRLAVPPQKSKLPTFRRTTKAAEPKTAPRAFLRLPEPPTDEHANQQPSPSQDRDEDEDDMGLGLDLDPPPQSSDPAERSSSPARSSDSSRGRASSPVTTSSQKRSRPTSSPPPTAKRIKQTAQEAAFVEGFVLVPGIKPKASDYAAIVHALLLRACSDYLSRVLAADAFPTVRLQMEWAKKSFKSACRTAGEGRYILTPRMIKVITVRGSHIRGKQVEAAHTLLPTKYGFVRGTSKNVIKANKTKAAQLLKKAAFHFKNPAERTGYAENKAIPGIRELTSFKDKDAVGVLFPSRFNPISLAYIALEMTVVEYVIEEWSTGVFIPAKGFYEKDVAAKYRTHLADAEKWSACNPTVVENIRRKWYRRASETLVPSTLTTMSTNIDDAQEEAMRDELAGRTGDTDSEDENNIAAA
ncbi:hypothetical protein B0H14DRAFT_2476855 [Mycena olivaceomarginata]|nr:hypothetical protein B0H14DRAFT_2476855 [Mycena olivaceomarginata]